MGHNRGGFPPQPTKLKKLKGNPGKRKLNNEEPKVEPIDGVPEPPDTLPEAGKREWLRIAALLHESQLLAKVDLTAFEAYCRVYARWINAELKVDEVGCIIKSPNGYPIQNPYLSIVNNSLAVMRGFLASFGMTPADRSRIHVQDKEKEKGQEAEIEDFLKKGKKFKIVK